jgi:hypothetical protein
MPSHRVHRFMDKLYFGKEYPMVHRHMDEPYKYFKKNHRILFHNYASAYVIARHYYPDSNAVWSGYMHIRTDELCSANPNYKKLLQDLEVLSRQKKKTLPSRKKRKKTELTKFVEYQTKQQANFMKFMRQSTKNMEKIYGAKTRARNLFT